MNKRAVLRFDGNLEQGFRVAVEIGEEGHLPFTEAIGHLPPASELVQCLNQWQTSYRELSGNTRISLQKITIQMGAVAQTEVCRQLAKELQQHFKAWLESSTFQVIGKRLREAITSDDPVRVLVHTQDNRLYFLPWQFWDFVDQYSNAEIAFCASAFKRNVVGERATDGKVRVLAILGDSSGIDVEADRQFLESLPFTAVTFLSEPSRQQINQQLWERSWDILFFAGHGRTEENQGRIFINAEDSLTIEELKYGLKQAVAKGLQLAIFNSCDGLGLAYELDQLHLPQLIVMREPIPDQVAQEFLRYFLTAYVCEDSICGNSLYLSERQARERLQGLEGEFPCASWLPVVFQNPAEIPPTWQSLRGQLREPSPYEPPAPQTSTQSASERTLDETQQRQSATLNASRPRLRLPVAFWSSLVATALILAARQLGFLQAWELRAFDQLLRNRPAEELTQPKRILIVEATETDVNTYNYPLPDAVLAQAIDKLEANQPSVIGLDIFRDRPTGEGHDKLAEQLQQDNLIALCSVGHANDPNKPGIAPPKVPQERLGFSNIVVDPDSVLRRHLVFMTPDNDSPCVTNFSLSALTALHYLDKKGIQPQQISGQRIRLGKTVLTPLEANAGAYKGLDYWGFQTLLNYADVGQFAERVTLADLLAGRVNPDWVRGRIVLIGMTAPISNPSDYFLTPYSAGQWPYEEVPGVILQAQMVNQILSAALDGRTLLWTWNAWGDGLWIWVWAAVGGIVAWRCQRLWVWSVVTISAAIVAYGVCFVVLIYGGWVPLIPSALALILTSGGAIAYAALWRRPHRFEVANQP